MPIPRALVTALAAVVLPAALSAQTTYVVSGTPGPDVDFPTIGLAVNATAPGDTIVLRPGLYNAPVIISKGITLQGDPGALFSAGQILVNAVPLGQTFVLRNFDLTVPNEPTATEPRIAISGCQGMVLCQDLSMNYKGSNPMTLSGSPRVALTRCSFVGNTPVTAINSGLSMSDSSIVVEAPGSYPFAGTVALSMLTSKLAIADCLIEGPGGETLFNSAVPAINAGGVVRIGGASTVIRVTATTTGISPNPAINAADTPAATTSVVVDPAVTLVPAPGSPAIVDSTFNGGATRIADVPSCVIRRELLGDVVELSGPANQAWFQFISTPPVFPVLTSVGLVWSDHTNLLLLGMGTYDASGQAVLPLPPPPGVALPDVMVLQTFVVTQRGGFVGMPTLFQN